MTYYRNTRFEVLARLAAWDAWANVEDAALAAGKVKLVARHRPPEGATWRGIDKCTKTLQEALGEKKV